MANAVVIAVGMTTQELVRGAQEVAGTVRAMGDNVRSSARTIGAAGPEGFGSLESSLKQFSKTARSEGRVVGFFARDIVEMTGASREAKEVLTGLLGGGFAIMSGNPILAGIELIKTGVGLMGMIGEEAKKAIEKSDKVVEPILKKWEERVRELNRELAVLKGGKISGSAFDYRQSVADINEQIKAIKEKSGWKDGDLQAVDWAVTAVEKLEKQKAQVLRDFSKAARAEQQIDIVEAAKKVAEEKKREQDAELKRLKEQHKKVLEENKQFLEASRDFSLAAHQSTHGVDLTNSQGGAFNLRGTEAMKNKNVEGMVGQYGVDIRKKSTGIGSAEDVEMAERFKKEKDSLKQMEASWQSYGSKVGDVLLDIMEGHKKWSDLFKMVLHDMARALLQSVIKTIVARAVESAANTEAQMSTQGPYGWLAGLGAMGTVLSAVMGLKDKVGSASEGWQLPGSGGPFFGMLHIDEKVLPARQSKGIDRIISAMERGQSGGGGGVTNIYAMDSQSFRDFYARQNRTVRDVHSEWQRTGR